MKIWSNEHIFNHPWDTVVTAAVKKYPNPMNPNVIGIDVIERNIEKGVITSHRLFTTHWGLPPWITKLVGTDRLCHASEHSIIDSNKKVMMLRTRNLTFNNIINLDETVTYRTHPEDESKTVLTQETAITVKNVPLTNYMEGLLANTMSGNAHKGRQAIEWVIRHMNNLSEEAQKI